MASASDIRRALEHTEALLRKMPTAVDSLDRFVSHMQRQRGIYRQTHGGREPRDVESVSYPIPGPDGLVELGSLDSIAYWADKGDGDERFIHDFGYRRDEQTLPQPLLCFCEGGLVIARGRSRYTVTSRGIEG